MSVSKEDFTVFDGLSNIFFKIPKIMTCTDKPSGLVDGSHKACSVGSASIFILPGKQAVGPVNLIQGREVLDCHISKTLIICSYIIFDEPLSEPLIIFQISDLCLACCSLIIISRLKNTIGTYKSTSFNCVSNTATGLKLTMLNYWKYIFLYLGSNIYVDNRWWRESHKGLFPRADDIISTRRTWECIKN